MIDAGPIGNVNRMCQNLFIWEGFRDSLEWLGAATSHDDLVATSGEFLGNRRRITRRTTHLSHKGFGSGFIFVEDTDGHGESLPIVLKPGVGSNGRLASRLQSSEEGTLRIDAGESGSIVDCCKRLTGRRIFAANLHRNSTLSRCRKKGVGSQLDRMDPGSFEIESRFARFVNSETLNAGTGEISVLGTVVGVIDDDGTAGGQLSIDLNASADAEAVRAILEQVAFSTAAPADTGQRGIGYLVTDGAGG